MKVDDELSEKLTNRSLRLLRTQLKSLEAIQRSAQPCTHCGLGGGLSPKGAMFALQLHDAIRKTAADQMNIRSQLSRLSERELETLAGTRKPEQAAPAATEETKPEQERLMLGDGNR